MKLDEVIKQDVPKHRKKSKTASSSASAKRSDHKHQYEKVIMGSWLGFQWATRCTVCGRFNDMYNNFKSRYEGLFNDDLKSPGLSIRKCLTADELHKKYPDIKIYIENETTHEYEEYKTD